MIKYNTTHTKAEVRALVFSFAEACTKNNQAYCKVDLINEDFTHSQVNVWQSTAKSFEVGQVFQSSVKVNDQGMSTAYADVTLSKLQQDDLLSKVNPAPPSKLAWDLTLSNLAALCTPREKEIINQIHPILYSQYSKAVAAKSNHHNFIGGLALHTLEMLNLYKSMYNALPFTTDPFIVTISILYHDWGKLKEYNLSEGISYNPAMALQGHPFLSAEHAAQALSKYELEPSTIQHIQHCILAHHGRLEWGSPVVPSTQEAFLVHHLDMLSGMGTAYKQTPNGEKSWCLQTTVYHNNQF